MTRINKQYTHILRFEDTSKTELDEIVDFIVHHKDKIHVMGIGDMYIEWKHIEDGEFRANVMMFTDTVVNKYTRCLIEQMKKVHGLIVSNYMITKPLSVQLAYE
jgi:hypothetical protein